MLFKFAFYTLSSSGEVLVLHVHHGKHLMDTLGLLINGLPRTPLRTDNIDVFADILAPTGTKVNPVTLPFLVFKAKAEIYVYSLKYQTKTFYDKA